jgi:site-specific recombinase XerD
MIFTASERFFDTMNDTMKKSVSINVKFKLRKDMNADGTMPLVIHITGSGERERINSHINVIPKLFNESTQRLKPINKEYQDYNLLIENYLSKISSIKTEFRLSDRHITPKLVKQELLGGLTRSNFVAFVAAALEDEKVKHAPGTYKRYESVHRKLVEFNPLIPFSEIDSKWFTKYRAWAIKRGNKTTTINNNVIAIKKFLRIAVANGVKLSFNLDDVIGGNTHGNRTYLNPPELKRLFKYYNSEFINESNKLILGYFLFACMTGLRISDLMDVDRENLLYNEISFINTKSSTDQYMLLNLTARQIVDLEPQLFIKKFADQTLNAEIKKIVTLCGITKKVSFHVARHTFATCFLRPEVGGTIHHLQKLLKHRDIKSTMIYAHILESEANEMVFALDKLF